MKIYGKWGTNYPEKGFIYKVANPSKNFYEKIGGTHITKKELLIGKEIFEECAYGWQL